MVSCEGASTKFSRADRCPSGLARSGAAHQRHGASTPCKRSGPRYLTNRICNPARASGSARGLVLDQSCRLDDANDAEGEHLAGYKEDGEINPQLRSSARVAGAKLGDSGL